MTDFSPEEMKQNFADVLTAQKESIKANEEKHANLIDKITTQEKAADALMEKMEAAEKAREANEAKVKELEIALARTSHATQNDALDLEGKEAVWRNAMGQKAPRDLQYTKDFYDLHKKAFDAWFQYGDRGLNATIQLSFL